MRNADIEVLDLVGGEGNSYLQNTTNSLEKLKTLHSKSNGINVRPLDTKPIYSYSSKELPELSFIGFGRARSSDNEEQLFRVNTYKKGTVENSLLLRAETDYDETGIDSLMADIAVGLSTVQDTQRAHIPDPLTPLGLIKGQVENNGDNSLQTENQLLLAENPPLDDWQAPELLHFGSDCKANSSDTTFSSEAQLGEIHGSMHSPQGFSREICQKRRN